MWRWSRGFISSLFGEVGLPLPYSVDFTALDDGPLPPEWSAGDTWSIASGAAVCTPATLGTELLTDPGLEANYTSGKCDSLVFAGTVTGVQSADVYDGAKAQQVTAATIAASGRWPDVSVAANRWYRFTCWSKRLASASGAEELFLQNRSVTGQEVRYFRINHDNWTEKRKTTLALGGELRASWRNQHSAFDTVAFDAGSLKQLSWPELLAVLPPSRADAVAKIAVTCPDSTAAGIVMRLDSAADPQNYLALLLVSAGGGAGGVWYLHLYKCVAGALTLLVKQAVTYVAGRVLELRCEGIQVQAWYHGSQVGATQTVDHAAINANATHGVFSTDGGNSLNSFFLSAP